LKKLKEIILDTVNDLVSAFLYYDRKEDEELALGDIEKAIENKDITINEIVECFKDSLIEELKNE
jgi:hypothetical protein